MTVTRNLCSRVFMATAAFAVVYLGLVIWTGWGDLVGQLRRISPMLLIMIVVLSLTNYGLRYLRWQIYLDSLSIAMPRRDSLALYFATYLMVITPGKLGEVFKAGVLRERHGAPLALGLPIVLVERIFDFLGVLVLAAVGWAAWPGPVAGLRTGLAVALAVPLALVLLRSRRLRQYLLQTATRAPQLARHRLALDEALAALSRLLGTRLVVVSLTLSTVAWTCESLSLWLLCRDLDSVVGVLPVIFVYAAATLVGSLVFLPGGLGGTEATMIWLLAQLGMSSQQGVAATMVVRVCTLWLAVAIGLAVYLGARDRLAAGAERTVSCCCSGPDRTPGRL